MDNKILMLILSLLINLTACKDADTNSQPNKTIENTTDREEHQHGDESEAIELDNGKKWKVNDNMLPFILNAEKIFYTYLGNNRNDYKELASQLESKNDSLTSNCTMDGKAHDELHKWLLPHLELTEELSEAKDENEAIEKIKELKLSFEEFHKYFE